jgi:tetratricopeptide (TPR) repeat protein
LGLAKAFIREKNFIDGMPYFNEAIKLDPDNPDAFYQRGLAKIDLNDYYGAIADFDEALMINSEFADAYMQRGSAKSFIGDKAGSCIDWSLAGQYGIMEAYDYIQSKCNAAVDRE